MNAQQLYQIYIEANESQGISVDAWDNLDQLEKAIWEWMANHISDMLS